MAKLVGCGKIAVEKFCDSYNAWKNHISHGNCYNLAKQFDKKLKRTKNECANIKTKHRT